MTRNGVPADTVSCDIESQAQPPQLVARSKHSMKFAIRLEDWIEPGVQRIRFVKLLFHTQAHDDSSCICRCGVCFVAEARTSH